MKRPKTTPSASLDALARCLSTSDDLSRPMSVFFQGIARGSFGPDEPLRSVDEALERAVQDAVGQLVGQLVGQHVAVGARDMVTMWSKARGRPFFHGALVVGPRLGVVIFFADRGLGCVTLTDGVEATYALVRASPAPASSRTSTIAWPA